MTDGLEPTTPRLKKASRFAARGILAACALALGIAVPHPAWADVRGTDAVLGQTAEDRAIDLAEMPDIAAAHALVMGSDGTVYFERDADTPVKIASITKVMTAILALENSRPSDVLTVSEKAATVGESAVGLKAGDTLTMEEALIGLMVMSGNDAAYAIAEHVGHKLDPKSSDPYAMFIEAMNSKAKELGCTDTVYENPHGLDFGAWTGTMHSTARDQAVIYAYAMQNKRFRELDNSDRTEMHVTSADGTPRTLPLTVRNSIRGQQGNIGGKTGTTYEAGECFIAAFDRDIYTETDLPADGGAEDAADGSNTEEGGAPDLSREIYVAVFGSTSDAQRFADTLALANWYYGHIAHVPLANTVSETADLPVAANAPCASWTDRTVPLTFEDPDATAAVWSLGGKLEQKIEYRKLSGNLDKGQHGGALSYLQNGEIIAKTELVTARAQNAPGIFERIAIFFDRIGRVLTGRPTVAEAQALNTAPDPLAYDAI